MTLWIAWSALVSALVAVGAAAIERVATHFGLARRFVWIVALTVASVAPVLLALRPTSIVETRLIEATSVLESTGEHRLAATTTLATIAPASVAVSKSSWIGLTDAWIMRGWLFASLAFLLLLLRAMWQLRAQRSRWVEGTLGGYPVLIARDAGPAVVGVRCPRVVIPRWVLDADDATQNLLLRHEMEHVRAGDSRVLFGAAVLRLLFPWNAALWWMTRRLGLAIEIDCDARVVRAIGSSHAYGVMLLAVGQRFAAAMPNSAFLSEPGTNLETRILAMTSPRLRRPIAASLPFAAIAIGVVAIAAQTPRPKPLVPPRVTRVDSVAKWRVTVDPKPLRGNPPPRYPEELRANRTEGRVHLTFTTDARGIPDTSTIRVLESTHEAFVAALRRVLPGWRYDTSGLVRMACRFFLAGSAMGDTVSAMTTVDGVSVWPVVITADPVVRPPAEQGVSIPNTTVGRAFRAWLDAQNNSDRARMLAYADKYTLDSARRRGVLRFYDEVGPLDLLAIRNSQERSLEFVVRERRRGGTDIGFAGVTPTDSSMASLRVLFGQPDDSAAWARLRQMRP